MKPISDLLLSIAACWAIFPTASACADSIWIEGEDPTASDVERHGWYDSVKKEVLSGGDWLSHYGAQAGEASYGIRVATTGRYTFWARLNPVASKPSWKLDDGGWTEVETKGGRGQQNIANDNKPTTALSPG